MIYGFYQHGTSAGAGRLGAAVRRHQVMLFPRCVLDTAAAVRGPRPAAGCLVAH